jgi:hypothetical protein
MESVLTAPVHFAQPHALPFRTVCEEHLQRHQAGFMVALAEVFPRVSSSLASTPSFSDGKLELEAEVVVERFATSVNGELAADSTLPTFAAIGAIVPAAERPDLPDPDSLRQLREALSRQEKAYAALDEANRRIGSGTRNFGTKRELAECHEADQPLKRLLHLADASALCLSGGGVRSASFCLGILEGLSRFNCEVRPSEKTGLMHELDYLSTVSGGGYIGSWMMAWTYRRMAAERPLRAVAETFDLASEAIGRSRALCLEAQSLVSPVPEIGSRTADTLQRQLLALQKAVVTGTQNASSASTDAATNSSAKSAYEPLIRRAESAVSQLEAAQNVLAVIGKDGFQNRENLVEDLGKIAAALEQAFASIGAACRQNWKKAYGEVIGALAGDSCTTAGDPEPQPVRHLRSYTSFLAPELGATLDTSTLAAIICRNLVVNWSMLVPALFAAISLTRWSAAFMVYASGGLPSGFRLASAVAALFLLATAAAATALPSHYKLPLPRWFRAIAVPLFLGSVFLGSWLIAASWRRSEQIVVWSNYLWLPLVHLARGHSPAIVRSGAATLPISVICFGLLAFSIFLTYRERVTGRLLGKWRGTWTVFFVMAVAAIVCAAITSAGLLALQHVVFPRMLHHAGSLSMAALESANLFVIFALPLVTLTLMASTSLFCALLGIYEMEEDREWWVRCGGGLLGLDLLWIAAHGITLYGKTTWYGLAGLALGGVGSMLGYSGATSAGPRPVKVSQMTGVGKFLAKHNLVLPVLSAIAVGLIAIGMVALEESLRLRLLGSTLKTSLEMLGLAAFLAVALNFAININLFSLQGMYRMRLMRAFLGASNELRRPDAFTEFDPRDTPYETELPSAPGAPLHVINTTLNLVGTKKTAWRQRRAESFTFSPIHAGSWRMGYVPADLYGGGRGVTLATAMAISGAAFNPNMGYQSSPLLSLLMTFFNLRLGYWLPNPKRPLPKLGFGATDSTFLSKAGPSFALGPLIEEALGLTDDTSRWIELTDGGHFENLGLYEMVLRRCKHIIVADAGADPQCQFEDLGNAIRKIQIDLGIPIEFMGGDLKMSAGAHENNSYCAVAKINYHCVDAPFGGRSDADMDGTLVYIKAGLNGREPADVLQYAKTHDDFPHESTANQFFNESQFESYRHLGSFAIKTIIGNAAPVSGVPAIQTFLTAARDHWDRAGVPVVAERRTSSPNGKAQVGGGVTPTPRAWQGDSQESGTWDGRERRRTQVSH